MKTSMIVACVCCALAAKASATAFVVPHVLESTGQLTANGLSSPLHMPLLTTAGGDVFGPDGDTGAFTYNYADAIRWTGSDFEGRAFTLEFDVDFCQNRPEGSGFRFEMVADPVLVSVDGFVVNAHADLLDISVFGTEAEPLSGQGVTLDLPALHFAAVDGGGHDETLDIDAGQLRIVPAPVSSALLALAGLFKMRRRR